MATIEKKADETKATKTGTERFVSRGLGSDRTPGCLVCGGKDDVYDNIAGFVLSKESGGLIVDMVDTGARLDWRPEEPHRIQVKIGACPKHINNLVLLHVLTEEANGTISKEMVDKAIKGGKYCVAHNGGSSYDGKPSEHIYPLSSVYSTEAEAEKAAKEFLELDYHKDSYDLRVYVVAPDGTKMPVFGNFDYVLDVGTAAIKDIRAAAKVKINNGFEAFAERIHDGYPDAFSMIKTIGDNKTVPEYKLDAVLVDMLERNGLVEEYEEGHLPFDRSEHSICLTDEGKELYEAIARLEEKEAKADGNKPKLRGGHGGE